MRWAHNMAIGAHAQPVFSADDDSHAFFAFMDEQGGFASLLSIEEPVTSPPRLPHTQYKFIAPRSR